MNKATPAALSRKATRKEITVIGIVLGGLAIMGAVVAVQTDREAEVNELSRAALVGQIDA